MEPFPDEVVVAVMGITGSGKSSFIQTVTGNNTIYIGHDLESGTSEVQSYRFTHKGTRYVLIDTPGFNDHSVSDEEVMNRLLAWLESSFRAGTRLNGIIYIHRIIDPKMQGSALSNMRMFRQLCGPSCFPNIILATTFWDDVPAHVGDSREEELKTSAEFWGSMVKKGSQVVKLGRGKGEGLKVLELLARKEKVTLRAQDEIVNEHKTRQDTAAAQALQSDIERQRKELQLRHEKIMAKMKLADQNRAGQEQMARERQAQHAKEKEADRIKRAERKEMEKRWKKEHDKQQKALKAQRAEQERTRRAAQRSEDERKNAEQERARREQKLKDEKAAYYASYVCRNPRELTSVQCSKCYKTLRYGKSYYHCCFCRGDNYSCCIDCGGHCSVQEHPRMKIRALRGCTVM